MGEMLSSTRSTAIPTLPGLPVLGNLLELRKDLVGVLHRLPRELGPFAFLKSGFVRILVVSEPEAIHEILVEKAASFVKSPGLTVFARPMLGDGLLTSERDFHRTQRRMIAPLFVQKRIVSYVAAMGRCTHDSVARIAKRKDLDVSEEAMRTTLAIVSRTLFDADVSDDTDEVSGALTDAMHAMMTQIQALVPMPPIVPTPTNRVGKRAVARLDAVVYRIIEERRREATGGKEREDLLSLLLSARDEDTGQSMDDRQIRDEAMTIFLAGHETTANAVTWALYLLSQNPAVRTRLEEEVDRTIGDRAPTVDDLKRLPYCLAVLKETLRLYPPAYMLGRRAIERVTIRGRPTPKRRIVLLNIAAVHRDPTTFPEPDRFDPSRFEGDKERALPKCAYMPFGAGPRVCIGNHFALMEGQVLLAMYARRFRFDPLSAGTPPLEPLVTLRPKGGMPMRVVLRSRESD